MGIQLEAIDGITIGDALTDPLHIENCTKGIYQINCSTSVEHTSVSHTERGIHAYDAGNLLVNACAFENCLKGVEDEYDIHLQVSNCTFNSGDKGVYTHFGFISSDRIVISIHDNTFTDMAVWAIQHVANHKCDYDIYNNSITSSGGETMTYPGGIEVDGLMDNVVDDRSFTDIYNNELYNLAKGIHLQSIDEVQVYANLHNQQMETPSYDYQTYGIKAENCADVVISNNSATSYGSSLETIWWSNGIMIDNCPRSQLLCNSVGNVGRGLWIGGSSPNPIVAGNAMGDCYDQLYLNWNLMGLGDQGSTSVATDNEWIGTVYTAGGGHQTNSYYSNYSKGMGYTNFYTRNYSPFEPTDNYSNDPVNDYDPCTANSIMSFETAAYCAERPELPSEIEMEMRIAQDSLNYESYYETFDWMSKAYLIKQSKSDANLLAEAVVMDAVDDLMGENVGIISQLNDSITLVNLDSASSVSVGQISSTNSSLIPVTVAEENYRDVNELYVSFVNNKSFTASEMAYITSLSELCPYAAGPAVYVARSLRELFDETPHRYASCLEFNPLPAERRAAAAQQSRLSKGYRLYPSPGKGDAVYEFAAFDAQVETLLKLVDYTGRIILEQKVNGLSSYSFKPLNLGVGVYRVQLYVNGNLTDARNMVVLQ